VLTPAIRAIATFVSLFYFSELEFTAKTFAGRMAEVFSIFQLSAAPQLQPSDERNYGKAYKPT
jgi:hypothetical protein